MFNDLIKRFLNPCDLMAASLADGSLTSLLACHSGDAKTRMPHDTDSLPRALFWRALMSRLGADSLAHATALRTGVPPVPSDGLDFMCRINAMNFVSFFPIELIVRQQHVVHGYERPSSAEFLLHGIPAWAPPSTAPSPNILSPDGTAPSS